MSAARTIGPAQARDARQAEWAAQVSRRKEGWVEPLVRLAPAVGPEVLVWETDADAGGKHSSGSRMVRIEAVSKNGIIFRSVSGSPVTAGWQDITSRHIWLDVLVPRPC